MRGHKQSVLNTAFSADSRWLATASSLADEQVVSPRAGERRQHDLGAGHDHRRPVGIERRNLPTLGERDRCETVELRVNPSTRKAVTMK